MEWQSESSREREVQFILITSILFAGQLCPAKFILSGQDRKIISQLNDDKPIAIINSNSSIYKKQQQEHEKHQKPQNQSLEASIVSNHQRIVIQSREKLLPCRGNRFRSA